MRGGLLTVMAGYCSGTTIPLSTQIWVDALRSHSQHLVLVFDNPAPAQIPESWSAPDCSSVFERHSGYDFGSYQRGLALARSQGLLDQARHVLFCNDSVIGPLANLTPLLERMCAAPDEAWGLTASHQLTPHLQSYFVVVGRDLLERPAPKAFFQAIEPLPSRYEVIQRYELGLSRALLAAGAALQAWVPAGQLLNPDDGQPASNPTAFPLSLVELGIPVIKKRALREESANQEGIAAACRLIAERNPSLWQALWNEQPQRRLWQEHLAVGVLLRASEHQRLAQHLAWLEAQAHPAARLLLVVPSEERQRLAQLRRDYEHAIQRERLQLLPLNTCSARDSLLQQALTLAGTDWICIADQDLWRHPLALSLQAQQIARAPTLRQSCGQPTLYRRDWLLHQPNQALHRLDASWA